MLAGLDLIIYSVIKNNRKFFYLSSFMITFFFFYLQRKKKHKSCWIFESAINYLKKKKNKHDLFFISSLKNNQRMMSFFLTPFCHWHENWTVGFIKTKKYMHHSHCFIKKLGFLGFCGKSFLNVWGKIKFFICRDALAISCFCLHFIQVC